MDLRDPLRIMVPRVADCDEGLNHNAMLGPLWLCLQALLRGPLARRDNAPTWTQFNLMNGPEMF
jgi:hypothetical protein